MFIQNLIARFIFILKQIKKRFIELPTYVAGSRVSELYNAPLMVVRHDNNCGYNYKGIAYSQIIDSVVEVAGKLGYESLSVATPYSRLYGRDAYCCPFIFNKSFFRASLLSKFFSFFVGNKKSQNYRKNSQKNIWKEIIKKVNPKIIIGIQPSGALCAAGKELGIKVFDYQHGVISEDQWWYGKTLPFKVPRKEMPDGFLCWDEASSDTLKKLLNNYNLQILALGNPWFNRFYCVDESDEIADYDFLAKLNKEKPSIIVSLQWGLKELYYIDREFNGLMCESLIKVIQNTQDRYNWLIRLHPVQMRSVNYPDIVSDLRSLFGGLNSVEWEQTSEAPLPAILKICSLHITDMSTVITEAAWAGISSCALNPLLRPGERLGKLFKNERNTGLLEVVDQTESDIEEWIESKIPGEKVHIDCINNSELKHFLLKNLK